MVHHFKFVYKTFILLHSQYTPSSFGKPKQICLNSLFDIVFSCFNVLVYSCFHLETVLSALKGLKVGLK